MIKYLNTFFRKLFETLNKKAVAKRFLYIFSLNKVNKKFEMASKIIGLRGT
jgi:hypothetical protein